MRMRRGIAVIAAIIMIAVLSAGSSLAATTTVGISDGAADVIINQTVVGFGGYEWWIIGDANGGVGQQLGGVTLLAKKADFGESAFNERDNWGNIANAYRDSTLQKKMASIAGGLAEKERGKINNRTLTSSDGISGDDVTNQKLWPLSGDEYLSIESVNVCSYGNDNWLRSPSSSSVIDHASFAPAYGASNISEVTVHLIMAVRPALNLNLSSVVFTSNAGQAGKSSATPGGGLVSVTAPVTTGDGNKIKYTFRDDENLKLENVYVSKIEGNKVTVAYDGATAGKTLSVIAKDKYGSVKFYGKLSSSTAASGAGEGSFEAPDNFDFSKHDLEVFVEEIGGENSSDFASTPKALDMTVKNLVTVNGGTGGGPYIKGDDVTLTADPAAQGKRFIRWDISPAVTLTQGSLTDETIKFTMPDEDVTATAVYEDVYTVTVTGGTGGGEYAECEEVTLTADPAPEGKRFKEWSINPAIEPTKGSLTSEEIVFNMPKQAVTATPVYEDLYTVTVNNGSISGGSGEYAKGEEVTLTADAAAEGKRFVRWDVSPAVTLTQGSLTDETIKFIMPDEDVTATAVYEDIPPVVYPIKGGSGSTWQQGDEGGLIVTSEGEHLKFTGVSLDGAVLDSTHYTVESGSTIITLRASYLSTLSVGEHVLRIHFIDGYTETKLNIQEQQTDNPNPPVDPGEQNPPVEQGGTTSTPTETAVAPADTSPKTGDSSLMWIIAAIMVVAGALMLIAAGKKQKA